METKRTPLLFLNVLIIATCGLIYELLAGTLASYLLGDSVTQFSLIIGIYLFAMGIGSWLSGFLVDNIAKKFIEVELAVALIGGFSAPVLFVCFAKVSFFHVVLYGLVLAIGTLVGLEIPLLMRILRDQLDFKDLVSRVLAFDYLGALFASLLFPLFFVPRLGLVRTSLVFGILNAVVAMWATWLLFPLMKNRVTGLRVRGAMVIVALVAGLIKADALTTLAESQMFSDDIVYTKDTPYQRIVVTRNNSGFQLYLSGNLQFASADEYRYHEALVYPAFSSTPNAAKVLVLGGGDGLALREILKDPRVKQVTLVDLDPGMTELSKSFPRLGELNHHSFDDPRVKVINDDAFVWVDRTSSEEKFDVAVVDFPDPNNFALGKLYTRRFYQMLSKHVATDGAVVVQTTSPIFSRAAYWCIVRTMESAGFVVRPYHVAVPSFGVWGYALAKKEAFDVPKHVPANLRFLNDDMLPTMFVLPEDLKPIPVEINRLDNQALVRYYEGEWRRFE